MTELYGPPMWTARELVGRADVLLMTFDTLRLDVANAALGRGLTPNLADVLPGGAQGGWEHRHTPGSFTYAAHHAFFAGFLPTPVPSLDPSSPRFPPHERLFAVDVPHSASIGPGTAVFDEPNIVAGFARRGYHTACVGGVGFFDKRSPLGRVLPGLFAESHWNPRLGVDDPASPRHQIEAALGILRRQPPQQRLFLFVNLSAMHPPNRIFAPGAAEDSPATMAAALAAVDRELPRLFAALRRPSLCVLCADHGTAYGENGLRGHRLAHPTVWDVPYAEFLLS